MIQHQTSKAYVIFAIVSFILGILAFVFTPDVFTSMLCDPNPSGMSLCPVKGGFAALMLALALVAVGCIFILLAVTNSRKK